MAGLRYELRVLALLSVAWGGMARGQAPTAALQGVVVATDGQAVEGAAVHVERMDHSVARDAVTDARGAFHFGSLTAGTYSVTVRRLGYQSAEEVGIRIASARTLELRVTLTQAARQLSTIDVVTSPVSVDASTPEIRIRLDRAITELVPASREASSLIALVPGARKHQLWGGVPGASNNYQLDGVPANHPGLGGDVLVLSVDWIEALDVQGLGAGAEHGEFQGGIINAVTRTGTNGRRGTVRTNYESARLSASNFDVNEEGVEQAGRRELSGEALGPIARDKLFYFVAGEFVGRDMRSPNLATAESRDFQRTLEEHLDARGMGKLTWLPGLGQRVDVVAGFSEAHADHAGINGVDDPTATQRVRQPGRFVEVAFTNATGARNSVDLRVVGLQSSARFSGYQGVSVPAVQLLRIGRTPVAQNAIFSERREPANIAGTVHWRTYQRFLGADHRLIVGADVSRGRWREERMRNAGMTWRPYATDSPTFNMLDAATWQTTGSDWGGDVRFDSDVGSEAAFVQENLSVGRVTLTPGVRFGDWHGYVRPNCAGSNVPCYRFEAVRARGLDPRIGASWDVFGTSTFAVKAHWGRYHQGMFSLFFDRALGTDAYDNKRYYYQAPPLTDARQTFTTAQRDAPGSGFSTFFDETILNEAGRVEGYRQPYVDQAVAAVEKSFAASWKAELVYVNRRNGDMVGLRDRNLWQNYSPIYNTSVDNQYIAGEILDAHGNRLKLPVIYVGNNDLIALLSNPPFRGPIPDGWNIAGYDTSYLRTLAWNPDLVLGVIPEAKRRYQQLTLSVRSHHPNWHADGSLTGARLKGNVPGMTSYGTTASQFSAGPFVRPNESINSDGFLSDALEFEGKLWVTARLRNNLQGGVLFTHILGERFTPTFELLGRYVYRDSTGATLPSALFRQIVGQTMFVEPRGSRQYASRDIMDVHLEWLPRKRVTIAADVFNLLGNRAAVSIKTAIDDQSTADPVSRFGAPRLRVAPRALRIGARLQ